MQNFIVRGKHAGQTGDYWTGRYGRERGVSRAMKRSRPELYGSGREGRFDVYGCDAAGRWHVWQAARAYRREMRYRMHA